MPAFLSIDGLTKRFGALTVLDGVTLEVARGEVLALLGPSGSGKTTMLRILAGFETADAGRLVADGREVGGLAPAERGFGMVFQHYALFPHLTVGENVAFGLESGRRGGGGRRSRQEIVARVAEMLRLVDLRGFEARRIEELSGGQQQRVALARALAPGPRLLLLDEPLSNLDPALRERTRREILQTVREVGITTVLVTHEQDEAFHLGDRVAVLHQGRLEQVGAPEELYQEPASRFVAGFVGRSSVLAGRLEGTGSESLRRVRLVGPGGCPAASGTSGEGASGAGSEASGTTGDVRNTGGSEASGTSELPVWEALLVGEAAAGETVDLVARPESLALVSEGTPGSLAGAVLSRRYAGPVTYVQVALDAPGLTGIELEVLVGAATTAVEGDRVAVAPRSGEVLDAPAPVLRAYPAAGAAGRAR